MSVIPSVPLPWLVKLVNEYAQQAREAAGEDHDPYPDVMTDPRAPRISRVAQHDLISIAQRLWLLFATVSEAERADMFNDMLDDAELSPKVNESGELFWMTSRTDSGPLLLAGCAAALLAATQEHNWRRLGICAGDDCVDVYVDEAGRGTRRYCSATCLNRARVRAYRSRQRAGWS
jgi:predicted RNA-binding Zn ribbon-like protein